MIPDYDVFISYSRDDQDRVRPWVEELKKGGVRVFFDTDSLLGGGKWQGEIVDAIATAKLVMLFVSDSSIYSEFVPKELALSVNMKKTILPVFIEPAEMRGQVAFCIADLQCVHAYDPDLKKVWGSIHASLKRAGVDWQPPPGRLIEVRRAGGHLPVDDSDGNVRIKRPDKPPAMRVDVGSGIVSGRLWRVWLLLMTAVMAVALFFWFDVPGWIERGAEKTSNESPPTPVPKAEPVETFEQEAANLARAYYEAVNSDPLSQTDYLADPVSYFGRPQWSVEKVKSDLADYARRWPRQQITVQGSPVIRVLEAGKSAQADIRLHCVSENDVVRNTTTFVGHLRVEMLKGALKIVEVSELPGTRKSEPLLFLEDGQRMATLDFITRAVESGNSDVDMPPETIARMYTKESEYFGRVVTHDKIIEEAQNLIKRWENRKYRILEGPEILGGLGTPNVEVDVKLEFQVSSPSRDVKGSAGWVRAAYLVRFSADGTPLIQKHEEKERGE